MSGSKFEEVKNEEVNVVLTKGEITAGLAAAQTVLGDEAVQLVRLLGSKEDNRALNDLINFQRKMLSTIEADLAIAKAKQQR